MKICSLVDAPVPYIIGVPELPSDKELRERLEKEKVIVYVDKNKVTLPFTGNKYFKKTS